jgi:DNA-binding response OmpR family regulator
MQSTSVAGRSILILEDEPLIALDIGDAFARAGAVVVPAKSLGTAHDLVEVNSLSAAVVDFRLGDGETDALCAKLTAASPSPVPAKADRFDAAPKAVRVVLRADVLSSTCIRLDHRSERQIARMIQRLLQNAMR